MYTYDGTYVTQTDYSDVTCTTATYVSSPMQAGCVGGSILSIASSYEDLPSGYYVKLVHCLVYM
jgi:hypothetical protein